MYNKFNLDLTQKQRTTFAFFAEILIPDLKEDQESKQKFVENFSNYFNSLNNSVQKQLSLLISLMNYLCFFYKGRVFNLCSTDQREDFVKKLFYFPIAKVVSGVSGLRSLCMFVYYGHADQWKKLNYDGPIKK